MKSLIFWHTKKDGSAGEPLPTAGAFKNLLINSMIVLCLLGGCATYKEQATPFKMPAAYANARKVVGATVAARAFADSSEARKAFGWTIREAGLLPVQVVFDNLGDYTLEIEPTQTFLIDEENNLWSILDSRLAYERVSKKTEIARVAGESVKPAIFAGAAGAIVGAAIGIVTGENVGSAAGKGAVLGTAVGATLGGGKAAASEDEARALISDDLESKSLDNKAVLPKTIAHGFIFFPGEAKGAKELRLKLRVAETGDLYLLPFVL
jgi:hypothetical protein